MDENMATEEAVLTESAPDSQAPEIHQPEELVFPEPPEEELIIPEPPEEEPAPKKQRKLYCEHILGIIAGVLAVILAVFAVVCIPYYQVEDDPELVIRNDPPATMPTRPPEGPTEPQYPPPELNPYGKLDFQFEGRYLGCLKADTIPGIDVSYYQGDIDWEQVAEAGIEFVIVRLGYRGYGQEGKLVEDKKAFQNIEGALKAGLDVGVYFFSQAITVEEALEEADFVLERIEKYDITMPVVYDWEYISEEARTANMDRRTLTDCYLAFCGKIAEAGYTPMPYFNTYQSRDLMILSELEDYPFWLALYSSRMTFPYRIEMWQYTDSGRVPGIQGNVDINMFFVED